MSIVDFFRKRLIGEKHLQLTIECHLVFDRTKIIDAPAQICVHGRWKIQKHQSIRHEILILFIVKNVYSRFYLEKD